jgi:hypothetical protein
MENKEFFSLFPEFRYEVFEEKIEKPLELNLYANSVVSINVSNTVITNAIEKSKLGEAGFVKHDIFSLEPKEGFPKKKMGIDPQK